jgi:catechol 2,3-dioxygenase-like lactoylglutathione lyase family enzyme
MSHVSLGVTEFAKARAFYDKVLATLGAKRIMEHADAVAYGHDWPEFWVQAPIDGKASGIGNGTHFGFTAQSKDEVRAFHATAIAAGATDDGPPGPRQEYGAPYYGCLVRDLDGHKIEAAFWDQALAEKLGMG